MLVLPGPRCRVMPAKAPSSTQVPLPSAVAAGRLPKAPAEKTGELVKEPASEGLVPPGHGPGVAALGAQQGLVGGQIVAVPGQELRQVVDGAGQLLVHRHDVLVAVLSAARAAAARLAQQAPDGPPGRRSCRRRPCGATRPAPRGELHPPEPVLLLLLVLMSFAPVSHFDGTVLGSASAAAC